jgi:hypothetical protein
LGSDTFITRIRICTVAAALPASAEEAKAETSAGQQHAEQRKFGFETSALCAP